MKAHEDRLTAIMLAYLEQPEAEEPAKELARMMSEDPRVPRRLALQALMAEQIRVMSVQGDNAQVIEHLLLQESGKGAAARSAREPERAGRPDAAERRADRERIPAGRRTAWGRWIAVASCLAITAGTVVYNYRRSTPAQFAEVLVAHVKATSQGVTIARRGESIVATIDMRILRGDRIETGGNQNATFVYENEKTEVKLDTNTRLDIGGGEEGKRLHLETGAIDTVVAPQPEGREMVISTPNAEAKVKGTSLSIGIERGETCLKVFEGRVSLTRLSDGASVDVSAGRYALAAEGLELAAFDLPEVLLPTAQAPEDPATDLTAVRLPAAKKFPRPQTAYYGKVLFEDDFDEGIDNWMVMVNPMSPGRKTGKTVLPAGKKAYLVEDGAQHLWAMEKNFTGGRKNAEGVSCVLLHPNVDDMVKDNEAFVDIMPIFASRKPIVGDSFVIEIRCHIGRVRKGGSNILTDCIEMNESLSLINNPKRGKLSKGWHIFRAECMPATGPAAGRFKGALVRHFWCGPKGDKYRESALIRSDTRKIQFGIRNGILAVDRVTVREILSHPAQEGAGQDE